MEPVWIRLMQTAIKTYDQQIKVGNFLNAKFLMHKMYPNIKNIFKGASSYKPKLNHWLLVQTFDVFESTELLKAIPHFFSLVVVVVRATWIFACRLIFFFFFFFFFIKTHNY